ncbi:Arc family DNA-binding protein [Proteus sp. G2659]|uniref:Arc family DNA-binding protein n=1 Tax=Proteus sp. G2659 TaxID=2698872 RepID=UPI001377FADF|nr:Arc family DNA-binding protein [Proteus sp. G2659]NBM79626.1 Arc family DNA-binding protein [Proteus sp. G2659]
MSERKYKHPQVNLRLPVELKDRIAELAEANGRSSNQEMTAAIEAWVRRNEHIHVLTISDLADKIKTLEYEICRIKEVININDKK